MASPLARDATLLMFLSLPHEETEERPMASVQELLISGLGLKPHEGYWCDDTKGYYLRPIPLPGITDTVCLRLTLNATHPATQRRAPERAAAVAWQELRDVLCAALPDAALHARLRGYTLVYHAVLLPDAQVQEVITQGQRVALPLHGEQRQHNQPLACVEIAHAGYLALLATPDHDQADRATVYLSLAAPGQNDAFVEQFLLAPSQLLLPDLVAHKAYHQIREYRPGEIVHGFRQALHDLGERSRQLRLSAEQQRAPGIDLSGAINLYSRLADAYLTFDALRASLLRQRHNYLVYARRAKLGPVGEYHREAIDIASKELEMLVDEGARPLEAARSAIDVVRAALERRNQQRQQRIASGLAVVGVLLTVTQIINLQVLAAWLKLFGWLPFARPDQGGDPNSFTPGQVIVLFGVQLALIALIVSIGLLVIWRRSRSS